MNVILDEPTAKRVLAGTRKIEKLAPRKRAAGMVGGAQGHSPLRIADVRWNATTKTVQVTYMDDPSESDWEDRIVFEPCPT